MAATLLAGRALAGEGACDLIHDRVEVHSLADREADDKLTR